MSEHLSPDIDRITTMFAGLGDEPVVMRGDQGPVLRNPFEVAR